MSNTLREVKLRVMDSEACHYFYSYSHKLQMCVGNPKAKRSAYKVTNSFTQRPGTLGKRERSRRVLSPGPVSGCAPRVVDTGILVDSGIQQPSSTFKLFTQPA